MSKHILITGSTDGIGKLTAIKLAQQGHTIYLHGRNQEKLLNTISELRRISGNNSIEGFVSDFSNLSDVIKMSEEVKSITPSLDVLINNAGIFKSNTVHSEGEIDIRFRVNYLAPFLLTNELIPLLVQGSSSRIINLSSAAQAPISLEALTGHEELMVQESYAQSKLALTMWSFYLAEKLKNISVLAVNPGSLLNTRMVQEAYGTHWSSADKGADILVELAVSEEYSGITGKYFDNDKGHKKGRFAQAHPDAYNQEKILTLIKKTLPLVDL